MTPACWDLFKERYEEKGMNCLAPAWPFLDRSIADLRDKTIDGLEKLSIQDIVDHYERIIRELPTPPILIGHSFGGLVVQMLLDRGLGVAGIAIDSGPPKGVFPHPVAIKSALPVLLAWRGWNRVLPMSLEAFSSTFVNTLSPKEQRNIYYRHVVPAPGRIYFQAALGIGTYVNFKNPGRAPLLLIAGESDRISTLSMAKSMLKKHKQSSAIVDLMVFARRDHWIIAGPGWMEVADKALDWALNFIPMDK